MKIAMAYGCFLALVMAPLLAQQPTLSVVLPQGLYADADDAANHLSAPPGARAQLRNAINASIRSNPRNSVALAHRAYFFLRDGDHARAKRDFDAALAAAEPGSAQERHVLWSRGWAEYDMGDYAAASADWQRAVALHHGRPSWAPYSFALLYCTAGQKEAALAWYDAAVQSSPEWGNAAGVASRTRHWSPFQQDNMRALFDAWTRRQDNNVAPGQSAGAKSVDVPRVPETIVAPDAKVEGASLGEWTSRWWRWALSQPIAPFMDPDGRICDQGQEGPVWYLAGTNGSFSVKRECVVPAGKYLLVPLINMIHMEADGARSRACGEMQAAAAVNNDHLASAVVLLDGEPLPDAAHYRLRSEGCFVLDHDEYGDVRAAADGYWMMLKPLPPGRHTLTIGANYGVPGESYGRMLQNFEYVLHVGGRTILSGVTGSSAATRVASR